MFGVDDKIPKLPLPCLKLRKGMGNRGEVADRPAASGGSKVTKNLLTNIPNILQSFLKQVAGSHFVDSSFSVEVPMLSL